MTVFSDIDDITTPDTDAQIQGMVSSLTNMQDQSRSTKRYFHGEIHNDSKKMCLVGFNEEQQAQLSDSHSPLTISHCEIQ